MEHQEEKHHRRAPGVSAIGLLTAACVFIVSAFCAVNAGFGESSYRDLENATRKVANKPAKVIPQPLSESPGEKAVALLEESSKKLKKEEQAATGGRKTATPKAKRAPRARTAPAKPRAKAAPAPREIYAAPETRPIIPRTKTAAATGGQKVPSAVKIPLPGQKIPDKVIKVEVPPPPSDKNDAPEWYTVKLKPVSNKNLAEATASGLRARGFVESQTVTGPGGTYFVKVGGYGFRNAAEDAKKQLSSLGFTDAHIEEKTVAK